MMNATVLMNGNGCGLVTIRIFVLVNVESKADKEI